MFKKYLYGGTVRDKLLHIESNDLDYVVVFDEPTNTIHAFESLQKQLKSDGLFVFHVTNDDRYTVRGKYPSTHDEYPDRYADFTLSESNGMTSDLESFLRRCDFTINAMAMTDDGNYIDPMGGIGDLERRFIVLCNDNAFAIDPIRIIRYFRFKYRFNLSRITTNDLSWSAFARMRLLNTDQFSAVSDNRIKDELLKCFKDPVVGCKVVCDLKSIVPEICEYIFSKFKLRASLIK